MKTSHRRIALLTGASLTALGFAATPALAAPPHTALADGVYPGANTTVDTIEICDIATPPGSPCFFGVIDTTNPAAALVNTTALGQIYQHDTATNVDLLLTNIGSAEVGAVAIATNTLGAATANATLSNAIQQSASATTGAANNTLDNDGSLYVDAFASAVGSGAASANATNYDAISQVASGVTGASNTVMVGCGTVRFQNVYMLRRYRAGPWACVYFVPGMSAPTTTEGGSGW